MPTFTPKRAEKARFQSISIKRGNFNLLLSYIKKAACFLLLAIFCNTLKAQNPPNGFTSALVSSGWSQAVGLTFSKSGNQMFVWEKGGKVWVVENGQKSLVIDISEEVGNWNDFGLLGFALHPDFDNNGYFYLLYIVDRHYLMNYGTSTYSSTTNEYLKATIGRLTRYTATKITNGYTVNKATRKVLIGATKSTGIPSLYKSHGIGTLLFGTDGTLLVSAGDGASYISVDKGSASETYYAQALTDGIITSEENVGAFRSQLLESYDGKILRIDPETGNGIGSNPFYEAGNPGSIRSKVWALGLRNPYRMAIKPNSGSLNPAEGKPGVLYVADVGYNTIEEMNIVTKAGMNFGWPIYEGLTEQYGYKNTNAFNYNAPNPLYSVNGCTQQYFYFQNLIKQQTASGSSVFLNPCNTSQQIPGNINTFEHSRPVIDWKHGSSTGPCRTGIFNGETAATINIGEAGSPISGNQFGGNAAIAGVIYENDDFPAEYKNSLFFGDYARQWIKNMTFDERGQPASVKAFVDTGAVVVAMATHPSQSGLFYINYPSEIKKIRCTNKPPVAVASSDKIYGSSPLTVQFTGSRSSDPEGNPLSYSWSFGDNTTSTDINPVHTFTTSANTPTNDTVILTVSDSKGGRDSASLVIYVNNAPPRVTITSPADGTLYSLNSETTYNLRASVSDDEHTSNELYYQWQTTLHHEDHTHPEPIDTDRETTTVISPLGCGAETYYYTIKLTVTDAAGLSATKEIKLLPDCNNTLPPRVTNIVATPYPDGTATISWTTDEMANSKVDYGTAANSLTLSLGNSSLVTSHSITLSGLAFGTTYYYRVTSADNAANATTSPANDHPPLSFTMPSPPAGNTAPVLTAIEPKRTAAGQTLSFTATGTDVDAGQSLLYSLINAPQGAKLNETSGAFSWTPSQAGSFTFTVKVTDNGSPALSDEEVVTVTVKNTSTYTLSPSADAFVRNGSYAAINYGSNSGLAIKSSSSSGFTRTSYLKFSLANVSKVSSARLRVYGRNIESTTLIMLSAFGVDNDSWTESGITWNNAPPALSTALSSTGVNDLEKYYELDVSSYVKSQFSVDKTVGLLIKDAANKNTNLVFNSKENAQNPPQLIVETEDIVAPVVNIKFNGSTNGTNSYTSQVEIVINASDQGGSGLASTEYSLNGGLYRAYTGAFIISTPGNYTIKAKAADGNANVTVTSEVAFSVVSQPTNVTYTLSPLADAFVRNGSYAATNYGSNVSLLAKSSSSSGFTRTSYLKFSLGSVSNVGSAKLRIYGRNTENTTLVTLSAFGVDNDSWTESGITWNTAPVALSSAINSTAVNDQAKYYEIDVTSYVRAQFSGDKTVSLLIKDPGKQNSTLTLNSKENLLNKPQLLISTSTARPTNNESFAELRETFEQSKVFPNPLNKIFNIKLSKRYTGRVFFQIIDPVGKVYPLSKSTTNGSTIEANISGLNLTPGIYFLRILSGEKSEIIKLVIQK